MLSEKPWRPESVLRLALWLFLSLSLGSLLVYLLNPPPRAPLAGDLKFYSFLINIVAFHGVSLLLIGLLLREHRVGWATAFGFGSQRLATALGLAVLVACLAVPLAILLASWTAEIMQHFSVKPEAQVAVKTLREAETLAQKIVFGLFAIGLAPFVEEVLFRGIFYPAIKQNGYPRLAWWATSLMFAATHSNVMTFIPLMLLSLALIWLYEKTDNLLAPILTHALFNATNFYWLLANQPPAALL